MLRTVLKTEHNPKSTPLRVRSYNSNPNNVPFNFLQIATWNDYEEGTAVEPGLQSCSLLTDISLNRATRRLTWTAYAGDADAWEIFSSADGQTLTRIARINDPNIRDFTLSDSSQRYFVKLVSKPLVHNDIDEVRCYFSGCPDCISTCRLRRPPREICGSYSQP